MVLTLPADTTTPVTLPTDKETVKKMEATNAAARADLTSFQIHQALVRANRKANQ